MDKINEIRELMQEYGLDGYVIPSSDPHLSEYIADHWESRSWLTGFDGSSGLVFITHSHAGVWTDPRYFLQAEIQLKGTGFALHKSTNGIIKDLLDWILKEMSPESSIGLDGRLFSVKLVENILKKFRIKDISLHSNIDLISKIWRNRPSLPIGDIFEMPESFAGVSRTKKIKKVQDTLQDGGIDYYLCSSLDDIAWVLNLRGNDIDFNPVFYAYLLIGRDQAWLFINPVKLKNNLANLLSDDGLEIQMYNQIGSFLKTIAPTEQIWIHKATTNHYLTSFINHNQIYWGKNLIANQKGQKNATEISQIRKAMVKDGMALVKLNRWLEATLTHSTPSEFEVAQKLEELRKDQGNYFGESFPAIVGFGPNGAIIHYRPNEIGATQIDDSNLLLIDSGGQYIEGTTDITRTFTFGNVTEEQQLHYTMVLKGHIAIASLQFLEGVKGQHMDILARQALWKAGLDYKHGTGHGVGYFLNVHEGPQGISMGSSYGKTVFKPGMITSNEPGFYLENQYGIRLENIILCVKGPKTSFGQFLFFETLSLFPFEKKLIDASLLSKEELNWLNDYHATVLEKIGPHLEETEKQWLEIKCSKISN